MDVYCPRCGEPWDMDSIRTEVAERLRVDSTATATFESVSAEFRTSGCVALNAAFGTTTCESQDNDRAAIAAALYDVLGDDMDGAASMFDDIGL